MKMPDRYVYVTITLDTNCINSRGSLPAVNQLERWKADGVITILGSEPFLEEAHAGGDSQRARKSLDQPFITRTTSNEDEQALKRSIEKVVFPAGAMTQNEKNDVEILFYARKWGVPLVTKDGGSRRQPGGMLGNRHALRELGITVMTDVEAVEVIKGKIRDRDELCRWATKECGVKLPDWVGKD